MKPKVYTYYDKDETLSGFDRLLEIWKAHWSAAGLDPIVLGIEDAKKHPRFEEVFDHVSKIPTVNPKKYEMACWLRWCAIEAVGGGLMVDMDVFINPLSYINMCLSNGSCGKHAETEIPEVLTIDGTPCAVVSYGNDGTIDIIMDFKHEDCVTVNGSSHGSDMFAFMKATAKLDKLVTYDACREASDPLSEASELIHYSSRSLNELGFCKVTISKAISLKAPKCYIAGPMTGYDNYNFDAFFEAEDKLRAIGFDVKNPARNTIDSGFDPKGVPSKEQMSAFIRWDVDQVLLVDVIYVLPGWEASKGAIAEIALAQLRGIPVKRICDLSTIEPLTEKTKQ